MNVASKANVRTAAAAQSGGMKAALSVARSRAVPLWACVVGLGLMGCGIIYILTGDNR